VPPGPPDRPGAVRPPGAARPTRVALVRARRPGLGRSQDEPEDSRLQTRRECAQAQTCRGRDDLLGQPALLKLDPRRPRLGIPIEPDDDGQELRILDGSEAEGTRTCPCGALIDDLGVRDLPDQAALSLQQQVLFVTVGHARERQRFSSPFDDLVEGCGRLRRAGYDEAPPPACPHPHRSLPPIPRGLHARRGACPRDEIRPLLRKHGRPPPRMSENAVGDVLEDHGRSQQLGRALHDRLGPRPIQTQLGVRLMDLPRMLEPGDLLRQETTVGVLRDPHELDPVREDDDGKLPRRGGRPHNRSRCLIEGGVLIDEFDDRAHGSDSLELIEEFGHRRRGVAESRGRGEHELPAFEEPFDVMRVGDVHPPDGPVETRRARQHLGLGRPDLVEFEQARDAQRRTIRFLRRVH
jgi:hypothetical protein